MLKNNQNRPRNDARSVRYSLVYLVRSCNCVKFSVIKRTILSKHQLCSVHTFFIDEYFQTRVNTIPYTKFKNYRIATITSSIWWFIINHKYSLLDSITIFFYFFVSESSSYVHLLICRFALFYSLFFVLGSSLHFTDCCLIACLPTHTACVFA